MLKGRLCLKADGPPPTSRLRPGGSRSSPARRAGSATRPRSRWPGPARRSSWRRAMDAIRGAHPGARLEARPLDIARLASVRDFAARWREEEGPLHVLLLNAGVASVPPREHT